MRAWIVRIITFAGLVSTVTGLPWFATLIWTGSFKTWFEARAVPILMGSCVASLVIAVLFDRFAVAERRQRSIIRRVPTERPNAPVANLPACERQRVLIVNAPVDPEVIQFANDIEIALANAGWRALHRYDPNAGDIRLRVEISNAATREQKKSAKAVVAWLKSIRIPVDRLRKTSGPLTDANGPVDADIKITVGSR